MQKCFMFQWVNGVKVLCTNDAVTMVHGVDAHPYCLSCFKQLCALLPHRQDLQERLNMLVSLAAQ